ncbi:hypothetical protein C4J95_2528 [Pseudomonas orientalis]|nr:hypothetical protein C4J95_2528 [Pseudomonas orientalis]
MIVDGLPAWIIHGTTVLIASTLLRVPPASKAAWMAVIQQPM